MADSHKNFSYSTVATAPSPATSGTSLVVAAADGTKFPTVPFNATVWPAATQPTAANAEIVRVTTISTDTFTITRAQESSSARTVVVGDQIAATVTAKTLTDVEADVALRAPLASPTFTGTATAAALTATGATTLGSTGQATIDASGNISTTGTLQGAATTATGILTAQSSVALATSSLGTKTSDFNILTVALATAITLNATSINYRAVKISPVVTVQTAPDLSGTVIGLHVNSVLQGNTGATDTFANGLFTGVLVGDQLKTQDTNSRALLIYTGINVLPTFSVFAAGSISVSTMNLVTSASVGIPSGATVTNLTGISLTGPNPASGGTCTTYTAVNIANGGSPGGTFTTYRGIDIPVLNRANTNVGIRNLSSLLQQGAFVGTPTTVTVTSNSGIVLSTSFVSNYTNSSAANMTVNMSNSTPTPSDGQISIVRIFDASGVAKTITWVNTENGEGTAPTTSNGSTTLPKTVVFQYNSATNLWRCIIT